MIKEFQGEYRFLSNFWPCLVYYEGQIWPSTEHLYQALKTIDPDSQERIRLAATPGAAKRMGKGIVLRPDWDQVKDLLMDEIVWRKFRQNANLREKLLATGDEELQEGNHWHDLYWGVDLKTGKGQNKLGKILQGVRQELKLNPPKPCPLCDGKGWVKVVTPYSVPISYTYGDCLCEKPA